MEANALALKHQNAAFKDGKERGHINGYGSDGEKQSSIFPSDCTGGFFADQFENMAKLGANYEGTGPEIWEQTRDHLDSFIAAVGTGGTVASVSRFLVKNDRLILGSSPAMNCIRAVRVAQWLGPGHALVTILWDSGMRHLSRFYDTQYLF